MKGLVWAVFFFAVGGLAQLAATPAAPQAKDDTGAAGGRVRTYYVAAEEVDWDYAPLNVDMTTGATGNRSREWRWRTHSRDRITSADLSQGDLPGIYRRDVHHAEAARAAGRVPWLLGPILRAEVGDTIKVVFKNMASRPYTMHPHGVFYEKASEGSMYADGVPTIKRPGPWCIPGATFTYEWKVPERAGPGPDDPNSIVWLYHSHIDEYKDVAAGLVGAIVVARRGQMNADGMPRTSTEKSSRSLPRSTKTRAGMWIRTWPPTSAPPTRRR